MKYMNFKRYKFSTVTKNFNTITYGFLKIFKFISLQRYNLKRIYRSLYFIKKININKYINFNSYKLYKIKNIRFSKNKFFLGISCNHINKNPIIQKSEAPFRWPQNVPHGCKYNYIFNKIN